VYADIPEALRSLIEPVVEDRGLELVDVELVRGRPPWRLRVVVDTPSGDGRVAIDRCAELSRELGPRLDAADPIQARYTLEVSSPGFDRVLAREKDFRAACGSEIRLQTRSAIEGRRRFRGLLESFDGSTALLSVDGARVEIPFANVARARTVYHFTRDDFAAAARASRSTK
jgi:ribosome maturation factor RimP